MEPVTVVDRLDPAGRFDAGPGGECPISGVGGVFFWWVLAAGVRSAKVVARVFRVGFQRHAPAGLSGALGVQRSHGQVERLQRGLLVREVTAGANGPAETSIQVLDRVRRSQDLADLDVVVQERHELGPSIAPEPNHRRVGLAPLLSELLGYSLGSRGFVDRFQVRGDLGPVLLGRVAETVAQQVGETGLDLRLAEHFPDAVRQAFEPVADHEEHVLDTAVLRLGQAVEARTSPIPLSLLPGQIPKMSLRPSRLTPITA